MSKPKVVRTRSVPMLIPGNKKKFDNLRKSSVGTPTKGILKRDSSLASSLGSENGSTPSGTPEYSTIAPRRKISQVRFSEGNIESPDYYLYNKERAGQGIVSPMTVFRKISFKENQRSSRDNDNDSVRCEEGSDDSLSDEDFNEVDIECANDDADTTRSNSPPPFRLSSSMSTEAQYALLKTYEDEMYDKIAETFPEVCERLEENRCHSPDSTQHHPHTLGSSEFTTDIDDLDDNVSLVSNIPGGKMDPYKVAQRIQRAMDILDSVRESSGQITTANACSNRNVAKNPVKSFEKWCRSLKNALDHVEGVKA